MSSLSLSASTPPQQEELQQIFSQGRVEILDSEISTAPTRWEQMCSEYVMEKLPHSKTPPRVPPLSAFSFLPFCDGFLLLFLPCPLHPKPSSLLLLVNASAAPMGLVSGGHSATPCSGEWGSPGGLVTPRASVSLDKHGNWRAECTLQLMKMKIRERAKPLGKERGCVIWVSIAFSEPLYSQTLQHKKGKTQMQLLMSED